MSVNGLIGRKVGMTSIFDPQGAMIGVTVIEVAPNKVVQRRTKDRDGYDAAALGIGARRASRTPRPQQAAAEKAGLAAWPEAIREVEVAEGSAIKTGDELKVADVFQVGQLVDLVGTSLGHGFQGVHKRHGFNLGPYTHGSKNYRETKSVGQNTFPARRWPGKRMAGHMGAVRRTVRNVRVVAVDAERNLLLVNGPVPGFDSGVVLVRRAAARNVK
jgi:large subunit ribosomal protein L3